MEVLEHHGVPAIEAVGEKDASEGRVIDRFDVAMRAADQPQTTLAAVVRS